MNFARQNQPPYQYPRPLNTVYKRENGRVQYATVQAGQHDDEALDEKERSDTAYYSQINAADMALH